MAQAIPDEEVKRRDPRFSPRPGSSTVEFRDPAAPGGIRMVAVTRVSVAGLAIETEADAAPPTGSTLAGVRVQVGDCELRGDLTVRNVTLLADSRVELGCVFLPHSTDDMTRLMALVSGMAVMARD